MKSAVSKEEIPHLILEPNRVDLSRDPAGDPLRVPVWQAGAAVAKEARGAGAAEAASARCVLAGGRAVAEGGAAAGTALGPRGVESLNKINE